jgi:hypothetical protein
LFDLKACLFGSLRCFLDLVVVGGGDEHGGDDTD